MAANIKTYVVKSLDEAAQDPGVKIKAYTRAGALTFFARTAYSAEPATQAEMLEAGRNNETIFDATSEQ